MAKEFAKEFEALGGVILTHCTVSNLTGPAGEEMDFSNGVRVHTKEHGNGFVCAHLISCAGAYSDKCVRIVWATATMFVVSFP